MKNNKLVILILAFILVSNIVHAQADAESGKKKRSISIGTNGIKVTTSDKEGTTVKVGNNENSDKDDDVFELHWGTLDLGINSLQDKTDYNSAAAQNFLKVDPTMKNSNLFDMNQGKSINVNIYPLLTTYRLSGSDNFRLYLVSGIGLQLYNFRFNKPISYINAATPAIIMDTAHFSKNKLAFDYLNIPLNLTFKNRLSKKRWLVYSVGLTGGYRLASWTKQISGERGKQKDHDQFDFSNFNSCVTTELGIDDVFRLYATYQLSSLQTTGLDQHPFCIGIRFGGI